MKGIILNVEQGSVEWLALRKSKITGTDAAKIMGLNPWCKPDVLLEKKLGLSNDSFKSQKMEKGNELEPLIRERINKELKTNFKPVVILHAAEEWAMASLDGINSESEILEIKCGEKAYEEAMKNIIPAYYMAQMQHCLWVSGATKCLYVAANPENIKERVIIEVLPDDDFISKMIKQEKEFFDRLMRCDVKWDSQLVDQDYQKLDSKEARILAQVYKETNEQIKILENKREDAKNELVALCNGNSSIVSSLKICKTMRKGSIDYSSIECLKSVNLDDYRKKPTEYWYIKE